ncbi:DEAD/DEAH box helicase [Hymenobacter mucosus]|uniref:Type III restriction enzyme n=1 Tax=Hymenobacter mucosus TaxID=1411120 RepID=A0A239AV92_9BACT|nr:DEAD/DEAH box helicase family protein [Hymenobacter mucosus]SNR99500.1 type III restriction enzyme [Hymenobacter mucosus]
MLTLRPYQAKAVDRLLDETYSLLARPVRRQKLVFKAPTGAGKTVVMAEFLSRLAEELTDRPELPVRQLAFIWIAPGHLHLQSYGALRQYFADTRAIHPVQFDDLTENHLRPNELLFLNWQSISSDKNLLVKDNEQQRNLASLVAQTKVRETQIVVVLDEAHLFASKGDKAQKVLNQLQAWVEVDVSATPFYKSDNQVVINREDVVRAEMIKRGVVLNPDLDANLQKGGDALNIVLLKLAIKRRQELADAYRAAGKDINPLLLIQLPSDTAKESALDRTIRDTMLAHLEGVEGITKDNGRLAVWLSGEKANLSGLEKATNPVEVLLFKQAIALGWDCPRAAVLLIFRELKQESFSIQTVGRILRMPEQQHYADERLNLGYVYTDLAKNNIKIEPDSADYLSLNKADRRADYAPLLLPAEHVTNQREQRNRLSSQFRAIFYKAAEARWEIARELLPGGQPFEEANEALLHKRGMHTEVDSIDIVIPANVTIHVVEVGQTAVDAGHQQKFAKTPFERQQLLQRFCRERCGIYAPAESTPVLQMALISLFEEYLGWDENRATKFILYPQNHTEIGALIDDALAAHTNYQQQKPGNARTLETVTWDVPVFEYYNDHYDEYDAPTHALQPTFLRRRADGHLADSKEELLFIQFLEDDFNAPHLQWWYKNGAGTRTDFAVVYSRTERGETRLAPFFVDFIILFANGTLGVFDTKTLDSDPHLVAKHNALHAWIAKRNTEQPGSTIGGVLIRDKTLWKYSTEPLSDNYSLTGWQVLNPALLAASVTA